MGLAVLQIVWLQKAVKSRAQDFDNDVFQAMYDMANDIENINLEPMLNAAFSQSHINNHITSKLNKHNEDLILNYYDTLGNYKQYVFPKDSFDAEKYRALKSRMLKTLPIEFDNLQELMAKQMISLLPINEWLDTSKLQSIIDKNLAHRGIKTTVQYGITEMAPNNFVLISKGVPLALLYKSKYEMELFSRSAFGGQKTLKLLFPERDKYLYFSMWPMILSSLFFFLLTVAAFGMSFQIIFQQKKLSDMKNDFISNMTHELKTPIATISLASEMLRDKSIASIESNRSKYANIIYDENKRLANHVENVLQIAKLDKGEIQLNKDYRNINEIIESVANRFSLMLEGLNGQIVMNFQAKNNVLYIDELHISNMINNLIDNAIKYNEETPLIKINTLDTPKGIQIEVIDNGIGLSKENQNKIFDKFYRVTKGDVHTVKGFGLGLSYVKSIVEAHEGKISVESKLKEGSKFIIQLPINN